MYKHTRHEMNRDVYTCTVHAGMTVPKQGGGVAIARLGRDGNMEQSLKYMYIGNHNYYFFHRI